MINAKTNGEKFAKYHAANPEIYRSFKKFTFEAIRAGRRRLGSALIIERIRWDTMIHGPGDLKVNNFVKPYYARMFMAEFPQFAGFFRTTAQFDPHRGVGQDAETHNGPTAGSFG